MRGDDCEACLDGCEGDDIREVLGANYKVLYSSGYNEGYGHHLYNTIYEASDGKLIHANCGGCSCYGTGDFSVCDSYEHAMTFIPEDEREDVRDSE